MPSSQSLGKPCNCATQRGFNNARLFPSVLGLSGSAWPSRKRSASVGLSTAFGDALRLILPAPASIVVGVGQAFTSVANPLPAFGDSSARLLLPQTVGVGHACAFRLIVEYFSSRRLLASSPSCFQSLASGVIHASPDEEDSFSSVRRANVFSSQLDGEQFVTSSRKLTRNPFAELHSFNVQAKDSARILRQHPHGFDFRHQAQKVRPEPAMIGGPFSLSGDAGGLAGNPAAKKVNCSAVLPDRFARECFDIIPPPNIWPMLRQHLLAKWLNFHLTNAAHSRAFKA